MVHVCVCACARAVRTCSRRTHCDHSRETPSASMSAPPHSTSASPSSLHVSSLHVSLSLLTPRLPPPPISLPPPRQPLPHSLPSVLSSALRASLLASHYHTWALVSIFHLKIRFSFSSFFWRVQFGVGGKVTRHQRSNRNRALAETGMLFGRVVVEHFDFDDLKTARRTSLSSIRVARFLFRPATRVHIPKRSAISHALPTC
eukprot:2075286-Rhodomonas_salina.4